MSYKKSQPHQTKLKINTSYKGETIEAKIRRILNNKEPISDTAPLIYTDRKDGVKPEHNIRTDRFEVAVEAMDNVTKSHIAKREERHNPKKDEPTENQPINKVEPIQATGQNKA